MHPDMLTSNDLVRVRYILGGHMALQSTSMLCTNEAWLRLAMHRIAHKGSRSSANHATKLMRSTGVTYPVCVQTAHLTLRSYDMDSLTGP
eukprot:364774-Chlamydomonas_euryale.AAC.20